jgi:hypothetical protein
MKPAFPSLLTPDANAGLALADTIADRLLAQMAQAQDRGERPGGMNYRIAPTVPREAIASAVFYTIAAANQGWPGAAS